MADEPSSTIPEIIKGKEDLIQKADAISLELDPKTVIERLDKWIDESTTYFNDTKKIKERQDQNKDYLMGKQWDARKVKRYNARYMNNIIYEGEQTIKPIAFSKMPDIGIKQGINTDQARMDAEAFRQIFTDEMKSRKERQVLGIAFSHVPVYYIGSIMPVWDVELGSHGDYDFDFIHPKLLILDSMANSLDASKHRFIGHYKPMTVQEIVLRFPKSEKKLLETLGIDRATTKEGRDKGMASTIKIAQIYFTYREKAEGGGVRKINAVIWKYKKVFLDMMKDYNWDWEGDDRVYHYDPEKMAKQRPDSNKLQDVLLHTNPQSMPGMPNIAQTSPSANGMLPGNLIQEKEYHNHFQSPRPPYILLGANQWGEMVYDETSRIEQVIPLQDNVNVRGRQITEIANRSRGKEIWALSTGIKKKDIENLNPSALNTDIVVRGNPRDVHEHVEGDQPKPALFQEMQLNIGYMFSKMGTHDSTRGIKQGKGKQQEQALLQQDMGRIEDLAESTINYAVEQMTQWRMQFIKLRYTVDHFKSILGPNGETTFHRVNRDMIHDNMDCIVTASGVDKILRKQEAYEQAKLKLTDPLTFHEDIGSSNPKGRAEKIYLFAKNPDMWYERFVKGQSVPQMVSQIGGQSIGQVGTPPSMGNTPPQGGQQPLQGGLPVQTGTAQPMQ